MKYLIMAMMIVLATMATGQRAKEGGMITVYVPDTVYLKEKTTIHVSYSGGTNGCAKGHRLKVRKKDLKYHITPYYKQKNSQNCAMNIPTHSDSFTFKPTKPGIYKFYRNKGDIMPAATTIVLKRPKKEHHPPEKLTM